MTSLPTPQPQVSNLVIAVGTLDIMVRRGRQQTRVDTRNTLRGREEQIAIQVRSPFGQVYALPIHLDSQVAGVELLETFEAGARIAVGGRLEWTERTDARYALGPGETGRRASELVFCGTTIRAAEQGDEPGCDVWLTGKVTSPPKVVRHPHKPSLLLAQTALKVSVERARGSSRARIVEFERVPLVVPVDHPDAPKLLRPGNEVVVEGMLERVALALRGPDVDRAVAAAEADWQERREGLVGQPEALRAAERRHARRVRGLSEALRSRVVAGYVDLISGTPATLSEAKAIREAFTRGQQARRAEEVQGSSR